MSKIDEYRRTLAQLSEWESYLLTNSGLPGPRGNIELAQAVADAGSEDQFNHYLSFSPEVALVNSPFEFLAFCGVVGLGRLAAGGRFDLFLRLRIYASDPRWRLREGVAMALQRVGEIDMEALLGEMERWVSDSSCCEEPKWLEMRAAAAAIAEPKLLKDDRYAAPTLDLMDRITAMIVTSVGLTSDRGGEPSQERHKGEDFKTFRQGLGYAWSVVVAAYPQKGKPVMEHWLSSADQDIHWIMKENLKKKRLDRTRAVDWLLEITPGDIILLSSLEEELRWPQKRSTLAKYAFSVAAPIPRSLRILLIIWVSSLNKPPLCVSATITSTSS